MSIANVASPRRIVTSDLVMEVSRAARPYTLLGWDLTVEWLIRNSTSEDWHQGYTTLTPRGAERLAALINTQQPWRETDTSITGEIVAITDSIVTTVDSVEPAEPVNEAPRQRGRKKPA